MIFAYSVLRFAQQSNRKLFQFLPRAQCLPTVSTFIHTFRVVRYHAPLFSLDIILQPPRLWCRATAIGAPKMYFLTQFFNNYRALRCHDRVVWPLCHVGNSSRRYFRTASTPLVVLRRHHAVCFRDPQQTPSQHAATHHPSSLPTYCAAALHSPSMPILSSQHHAQLHNCSVRLVQVTAPTEHVALLVANIQAATTTLLTPVLRLSDSPYLISHLIL